MSKQIHKHWRKDLNLYETKINLFWFIHYYVYSIRHGAEVTTKWRLFKYKNPDYMKGPTSIDVKTHVGRKEFKTKYLSNKWMIPINKYLDLNQND